MKPRTDGRDLAHERWADAEQVRRLNAYNGTGHAFGPDDTHALRLDREDDEALWQALLSSPEASDGGTD